MLERQELDIGADVDDSYYNLDYLLYGDQRAFRALVPFNPWARNTTANRPKTFHDGYLLNGKPLADEGSDSPAMAATGGDTAVIPNAASNCTRGNGV